MSAHTHDHHAHGGDGPAAVALRRVGFSYDQRVALDDVSFEVARGSFTALIGPNGAGKTTLVNLLTGVLAPTAGRILLDGEDIGRLAAHQRVGRGLVRTFQINQLFD